MNAKAAQGLAYATPDGQGLLIAGAPRTHHAPRQATLHMGREACPSLLTPFCSGALLAFGASGPRGAMVSLPPDNSIGFFNDLYGVASGDGERNDG